MKTFTTETTVIADGKLSLDALPFEAGEHVKIVIVSEEKPVPKSDNPHPFKGEPLTYIRPFDPAVPDEDWDVLS